MFTCLQYVFLFKMYESICVRTVQLQNSGLLLNFDRYDKRQRMVEKTIR